MTSADIADRIHDHAECAPAHRDPGIWHALREQLVEAILAETGRAETADIHQALVAALRRRAPKRRTT